MRAWVRTVPSRGRDRGKRPRLGMEFREEKRGRARPLAASGRLTALGQPLLIRGGTPVAEKVRCGGQGAQSPQKSSR